MMQLQKADGVVKSVLEVRQIRSEMNDADFALWYEEHFMITERILNAVKGMSTCQSAS